MGGIGTAICRRLAADGNKVVANCLPGYDKKDAWLASMSAQGYDVHAAEGSVEEFDSCADMFYRIASVLGPVDILVNNAGITRDGVFKRMSESDWYDVINTNLNGVFNVTRQVIEGMMDRGWGRVINVSSVNALKGQFGQTNYSAAKAGMHGFSKALAQEVVRKGVTVNTISPGYVATDMVMAIREEVREQSRTRSPVWCPICAPMVRATLPARISPSMAACTCSRPTAAPWRGADSAAVRITSFWWCR